MNSRTISKYFWSILIIGSLGISACSTKEMATVKEEMPAMETPTTEPATTEEPAMEKDPRVGLKAGLFDAGEAISNLKLISTTPPPEAFLGVTNSDLAFKGNYAFQGNYNGVQVWDISNPAAPTLAKEFVCPASQSDVSVYGNLMFVSGEGFSGRLDCGSGGVQEQVSMDRLRGIRVFDITDLDNPVNVANVQTCRGSHTHTVLKDPNDNDNVYIYVSGSAPVRSAEEVDGCSGASPDEDPNTALFRIEVIKVPLADPASSAIVSSPRIFEDLVEPEQHGPAPADLREIEEARAAGKHVVFFAGQDRVLPDRFVNGMMQEYMTSNNITEASAADSASFKEALPGMLAARFGGGEGEEEDAGPKPGPTQCHDITVYPELGLAGGACEGYGLLLDISDPVNPVRIDAVADSNFSYWHSATFNNDGSKILFTDEWGGGGGPKCRVDDPMEWGANAIFTLKDGKMDFKKYYKLSAAQTPQENCVAHNGSLIPIPGRDIMVQSWYQGGISIFDWTDAMNPVEIAYHDRGPVNPDQMAMGGSWSVYWYNGLLVNSEIARGLDIFELVPSEHLSAAEIAAANTVKLDYLNAQGQPTYSWPDSFELSEAYLDQLARGKNLDAARVDRIRDGLMQAKAAPAAAKKEILTKIAEGTSRLTHPKAKMLTASLKSLASTF